MNQDRFKMSKDLTTQQAADFLKVSRPFLIKQLEDGLIPFYLVGTHRRIVPSDISSYKDAMRKSRNIALDELSKLGQEVEDMVINKKGPQQ